MQILKQWKTEPEKWLFRILLVVFIASMVPVLYLSRYGFPNCDDFTYGLETHRVWNATHSFVEVLKTALAVQKDVPVSARWRAYMRDVIRMEQDPKSGAQPHLEQGFFFGGR